MLIGMSVGMASGTIFYTIMEVPKTKIKNRTCDLVIPILGMCQNEMKSVHQRHLHSHVHHDLFTTAQMSHG